MTLNNLPKRSAIMVTLAALLLPAPLAMAVETPSRQRDDSGVVSRDIELASGGVLQGQIVNAQGVPAAHQQVSVHQAGQTVATATTDEHGLFSVSNLPSGMYQVVGGNTVVNCRLWANGSAPPIAKHQMLLVSQESQIRGQGDGSFNGLGVLAGCCIIAGIVVAIDGIYSDSYSGS